MTTRRRGQKRTPGSPALRGKQLKVFSDLAAGSTIRGAAKNAGVSPTTVYAWMKDPAFRNALTEARAAAVFAAKDTIKLLGENAIARLNQIMEGQDIGQSRMAATTILTQVLAIEKDEAMEARLQTIEKALDIRQAGAQLRDLVEAAEKGKPS